MFEVNKIYNEDCIAGMKQIPDNTIDAIITSPPYNKTGLCGGKRQIGNNIWKRFNIDYATYDDNMDEEEYVKWQIDILNEFERILKPNGSVFYNHKIRRYNNKAYFPEWIFKTKLNLYQMIVWNRINCSDMRNDYLYPTTELIFWMCKDKPTVYKENADFKGEVWNILPNSDKDFPASYPIELAENCIKLSTKENDLILDPFMGSGTTAKASKNLQRNYIGFEIAPNYIELANRRLNDVEKVSIGGNSYNFYKDFIFDN